MCWDRLLLWPQLLPSNHNFFFFPTVSKRSDDERLHLISRWRFPHTNKPQIPNQPERWLWGLHFLCFFYCWFFPPLICTAGRNLFWNIFSFILRETCWCAWVGDLVLFLFVCFLKKKKKKAICLNFSLHSLPLRFTLEKLNYKKYNKYLLNWWKQ